MGTSASEEIRIRIRVHNPPPDVRFQVQRGRDSLVPEVLRLPSSTEFEFSVRVGKRDDGSPSFRGPCTQGPPHARFVYVNSGTLAGDAASCWTRRAKVPLAGITWTLIREARARDAVLEADIAGVAGDGGPACGSVPLRHGWRVAASRTGAEG